MSVVRSLASGNGSLKFQAGVTLVELLIAMAISLVVSLAMIAMMSSTLSTGTTTIQSVRLTAELRTALQIMSRDVRRANYHGNYVRCFGNLDCRVTLDDGDIDASAYIKPLTISDAAGTDDCFFYWFDRDSDGVVTGDDDEVGAFRRVVVDGVGILQMALSWQAAPSCTSGAYWTDITDADVVNVTAFSISNNLSYTDTISSAGATQTVEKVRMTITGQLIRRPAVSKTVENLIRVRNDIFAPPAV